MAQLSHRTSLPNRPLSDEGETALGIQVAKAVRESVEGEAGETVGLWIAESSRRQERQKRQLERPDWYLTGYSRRCIEAGVTRIIIRTTL